MTDKFRDTLHEQAEAAGFAPVDLDAIVSKGARTVRRRRTAAVTAGIAGLAAAVAVIVSLALPAPEQAEIVPAVPFPTRTRAFDPVITIGQRAFVGDQTLQLEHPVDRLVRNDDAFVYLSGSDLETRIGEVYSAKGGVEAGYGAGYDLSADSDGHVVAWLRPGATLDDARLVVLDTRTLATREVPLEPTGDPALPPRLRDVEGSTLYLHDGRGEYSYDLLTGATTAMDGLVVDAESDVVVVEAPETTDAKVVLVAERPDGGRTVLGEARRGTLSPDGRYFATSSQNQTTPGVDPRILAAVDTETGESRSVDVDSVVAGDGPGIVDVFGWLDNDRMVVLWSADRGAKRYLACDVPTGACEVVVADVLGLPSDEPNPDIGYPGETTYEPRSRG